MLIWLSVPQIIMQVVSSCRKRSLIIRRLESSEERLPGQREVMYSDIVLVDLAIVV